MPIKHQAESFRHFNGERYQSWGDYEKTIAGLVAADLRKQGVSVRSVDIGNDERRLFIRGADPTSGDHHG